MRLLLFAAPLVFLLAACGSDGQPVGDGPFSDGGTYIALGNSLSEGVGASDRETTAFVPLVHEGLGDGFELLNLGHSGDTSRDLIDHGHLDEAILEVNERNSDDDPDNDVKLVTLEIGGNDLLELFFNLVLPGTCPSVTESLARPQCVDALRQALDRFGPNLETALDRLQQADPDLTIAVMTLYNPFSGGIETVAEIAEVALEGEPDTPFPAGLNDLIRSETSARGLTQVDWYPLFVGKAGEYVSPDLIHPNDTGYEVLANAVLEAIR